MPIIRDEPKRLRNLKAPPEGHGLDFADARERFEWETALILPANPSRIGTERQMAIGFLDGRLVSFGYAELGPKPSRRSAFAWPVTGREKLMSPHKLERPVPMPSDAEEAALQEQIANDPDAAEATDAQLARMRPAREALPPALYKALTTRGPQKAPTKQPVSLRIDRDVLDRFKATGPGWQSRMNAALRRAAADLPEG